MTDATRFPPEVSDIIDMVIMSFREQMALGKEPGPHYYVLNYTTKVYKGGSTDMGENEGERIALAAKILGEAEALDADAALLISEVWTPPDGLTPDEVRAMYDKYEAVSNMPGRREMLMVNLHTHDGVVMGLAPITGKGLDRRCGDFEMAKDPRPASERNGEIFGNLLHSRVEVALRKEVLDDFSRKMTAANLDPHTLIGEKSSYQTLSEKLKALPVGWAENVANPDKVTAFAVLAKLNDVMVEATKHFLAQQESGKTYVIIPRKEGPIIGCLKCGKHSYNQDDVRKLYCGYCKEFHSA